MSTRKKLIISLCSLCLVAAIVVIGVFAFATQSYTVGYNVTFSARNVKGSVKVYMQNNGGTIAQQGDTQSYDGTETSDSNVSTVNIGTSSSPISFTINDDGSVGDIIIYIVIENSDTVNAMNAKFTNTPTLSGVTVTEEYKTVTTEPTTGTADTDLSKLTSYTAIVDHEDTVAVAKKTTGDTPETTYAVFKITLHVTTTGENPGVTNGASASGSLAFVLTSVAPVA